MSETVIPRCGDHIFHKPTEETWIVAYCEGDVLVATGWPGSIARTSDCVLTVQVSDAGHRRFVAQWRKSDDPRSVHVARLYGNKGF